MKKLTLTIFYSALILVGAALNYSAEAQIVNPSGTVKTCSNEGAGVAVCDTSNSTPKNLAFKTLVQGSNITLTDGGAAGITIAAAGGATYATGGWTPASATVSITNPVAATYTQIGNSLFGTFHMQFPASASGSAVQITGIPVSCAVSGPGWIAYTDYSTTQIIIEVQSGVMFFTKPGASNITYTDLSSKTVYGGFMCKV